MRLSGSAHPSWRGDHATDDSKRDRARRWFPAEGPCQRCGADGKVERHHVDGDPGNNEPENIMIVCRRCHHEVDGRVDAMRARVEAARARAAAITRCPQGHPYNEANTYRYGNKRNCRVCARERAQLRRRRERHYGRRFCP